MNEKLNNTTYLIPVLETAKEAWQKVKGSKKIFWLAIGLIIVVDIIINIFYSNTKHLFIIGFLISLIGSFVGVLFNMGLIYMGMQRAADLPLRFKDLFRAFDGWRALKIIGVYIIQLILLVIPFGILFFLGFLFFLLTYHTAASILAYLFIAACTLAFLYVLCRMILAFCLVLDKDLNSWEAIKQSFDATRSNFWNIVGLVLILIGAPILGVLLLGIGLIWAIPFAFILYGLIYKKLSVNLSSKQS